VREYTVLLRVRVQAESLGAAVRHGQELAESLNGSEQNDCWGYVGTMEVPERPPQPGDILR
jgi:hypothetical protein